jgi:hypothetical protein
VCRICDNSSAILSVIYFISNKSIFSVRYVLEFFIHGISNPCNSTTSWVFCFTHEKTKTQRN